MRRPVALIALSCMVYALTTLVMVGVGGDDVCSTAGGLGCGTSAASDDETSFLMLRNRASLLKATTAAAAAAAAPPSPFAVASPWATPGLQAQACPALDRTSRALWDRLRPAAPAAVADETNAASDVVWAGSAPARALLIEAGARHAGEAVRVLPSCRPEEGVLIGKFDAAQNYVQSCCRLGEACSGCASATSSGCGTCAGGFELQTIPTTTTKRCFMCDDIPGWTDSEGKTCEDYALKCGGAWPPEHDDMPYHGVRPSDACCACGGGTVSPTPFEFDISSRILRPGQTVTAWARPVTSTVVEVDGDCSLADLGFEVASPGKVKGRASAPGDRSCTVSAVQDPVRGIVEETTVDVTVKNFSYGYKTLTFIFDGLLDADPETKSYYALASGKHPRNFSLVCTPEVDWLRIDVDTGALSYARDQQMLQPPDNVKTRCQITAVQNVDPCTDKGVDPHSVQNHSVLSTYIQVQLLRRWASGRYKFEDIEGHIGEILKSSALEERLPEGYEFYDRPGKDLAVQLMREKANGSLLAILPAVAPSILDVACGAVVGEGQHEHLKWSRQTGDVRWKGRLAFNMNPTTGEVSGAPDLDLSHDLGLSRINVSCSVALGGVGYTATSSSAGKDIGTAAIRVTLKDNTCWIPSNQTTLDESPKNWVEQARVSSKGQCLSRCRNASDCGLASWDGNDGSCFTQTSRPRKEGSQALITRPRETWITKVSDCLESQTCISLAAAQGALVEGEFCPQPSPNGAHVDDPVYKRSGLTPQGQLFLARVTAGGAPLGDCAEGEWVMVHASARDYENTETGDREFYGHKAACMTAAPGAEDPIAMVFIGGWAKANLSFDLRETEDAKAFDGSYPIPVGAVTAALSIKAPDCAAPETDGVSSDLTFGTLEEPDKYALDPCECFGEGFAGTRSVDKSVSARVPRHGGSFNRFALDFALVFEGAYTCEADAVIAQHFDVEEEECKELCATEATCMFFIHEKEGDPPRCVLLSACDYIGEAGIQLKSKLFGKVNDRVCMIADPERCWVEQKRRALLSMEPSAAQRCKLQDQLEKCDALQLIVGIQRGICWRCMYMSLTEWTNKSLHKVPLPDTFASGSHLQAGCSYTSRLFGAGYGDGGDEVKSIGSTTFTCVSGNWRGEALPSIAPDLAERWLSIENLMCHSCVQVGTPELQQRKEADVLELHFLRYRVVKSTYGMSNLGCRHASMAARAPLRSALDGNTVSLVFHPEAILQLVWTDSNYVWYLDDTRRLVVQERGSGPSEASKWCLTASSRPDGALKFGKCQSPLAFACAIDVQGRLVCENGGMLAGSYVCLKRFSGGGGGGGDYIKADVCDDALEGKWYFDGGSCMWVMDAVDEGNHQFAIKQEPIQDWQPFRDDNQLTPALRLITSRRQNEYIRQLCKPSVGTYPTPDCVDLGICRVNFDVAIRNDWWVDATDERWLECPLGYTPLSFAHEKSTAYRASSSIQIRLGTNNLLHVCSAQNMSASADHGLFEDFPDHLLAKCGTNVRLQPGVLQEATARYRRPHTYRYDQVKLTFTRTCAVLGNSPIDDSLAADATKLGLTTEQFLSILRDQALANSQATSASRSSLFEEQVRLAMLEVFEEQVRLAMLEGEGEVRAGYFTLIGLGQAAFGTTCPDGTVVAVTDTVVAGCTYVNAGKETEHRGALAGSFQCPHGQAISGWLNLPGQLANYTYWTWGTNGLEKETLKRSFGLEVRCREVPGLTTLCKPPSSHPCSEGHLLVGLEYKITSNSFKYVCCAFKQNIALSLTSYRPRYRWPQPFEGYYCPARMDNTGRLQYQEQKLAKLGDMNPNLHRNRPTCHPCLLFWDRFAGAWRLDGTDGPWEDRWRFVSSTTKGDQVNPVHVKANKDTDQFSVVGIEPLHAHFLEEVQPTPTLKQEKPEYPKLAPFTPEQPKYAQYCDPAYLQNPAAHQDAMTEPTNPCYHTYNAKIGVDATMKVQDAITGITEDHIWECAMREVERETVAKKREADDMIAKGKSAQIQDTIDMAITVSELAASLATAAIWGGWSTSSSKGAEEVGEKMEKRVAKNAERIVLANQKNSGEIHALRERIRNQMVDVEAAKMVKQAAFAKSPEGIQKKIFDRLEQKSKGYQKFTKFRKMQKASSRPTEEAYAAELVPNLEKGDIYGFAQAENTKKLADANQWDCSPTAWGFSRLMCDMYCTQDALRKGNEAIIGNIKSSHDNMLANLEALMNYHSQYILWALGQSGVGNSGSAKTSSGAALPEVAQLLTELRDMPSLLRLPEPSAPPPLDALDWHRQAAPSFLTSVQSALQNATAETLGFRIGRVRALTQGFRARLDEKMQPPRSKPETADRILQRRVDAMGGRLSRHRERVERVGGHSPGHGPVDKDALVVFAAPDSGTAAAWESLVDALMRAHMRHNVYVEHRMRFLDAGAVALNQSQSFMDCAADTVDLQQSWQLARSADERAEEALLEAWAATVAAQERLQIAVEAEQLPSRIAAAVRLTDAPEAEACAGFAEVARAAHEVAVARSEGALWQLTKQVLVLSSMAEFQKEELQSRRLRRVEEVDLAPVAVSIQTAAAAAADPTHARGLALAARAVDAMGPIWCPAPEGCHGMLIVTNDSASEPQQSHGGAWVTAQPGAMLRAKSPSTLVTWCAAGESEQPAPAIAETQERDVRAHASGTDEASSGTEALLRQLLDLELAKHAAVKGRCAGDCAAAVQVELPVQESLVAAFWGVVL